MQAKGIFLVATGIVLLITLIFLFIQTRTHSSKTIYKSKMAEEKAN